MILAASYDWFACSLLKHLPSLVPAFSLLSFTTQLPRHFSWMLIGVEVRNVTAIFPWLWIHAPVHTWPPFRDGPGDIILTPSLSLSLSLQVVSHQFTPSPTRRRWLTRDLRPRMWSRRTLRWHQSAKQPKRRFEYPRQRRVNKTSLRINQLPSTHLPVAARDAEFVFSAPSDQKENSRMSLALFYTSLYNSASHGG